MTDYYPVTPKRESETEANHQIDGGEVLIPRDKEDSRQENKKDKKLKKASSKTKVKISAHTSEVDNQSKKRSAKKKTKVSHTENILKDQNQVKISNKKSSDLWKSPTAKCYVLLLFQ
jgi:hypothetical protein